MRPRTQTDQLYRLLTAPYRITRPVTSTETCQKKHRYCERTARRIVMQMRARPQTYQPELLNAYACGHCQRWHVGHYPVHHFSGKLRIEERV
jgi:hypothetical protein